MNREPGRAGPNSTRLAAGPRVQHITKTKKKHTQKKKIKIRLIMCQYCATCVNIMSHVSTSAHGEAESVREKVFMKSGKHPPPHSTSVVLPVFRRFERVLLRVAILKARARKCEITLDQRPKMCQKNGLVDLILKSQKRDIFF